MACWSWSATPTYTGVLCGNHTVGEHPHERLELGTRVAHHTYADGQPCEVLNVLGLRGREQRRLAIRRQCLDDGAHVLLET